MTQEQWGQLRQSLLGMVGQNNFTNWIEPIEFSDIRDGVAIFNVPTSFLGNYVQQNFGDLILHKLAHSGAQVRRVQFSVAASSPARANAQPSVKPAAETGNAQPARPTAELLPGAPLDGRFTFDTFVVGKPNELAHAAGIDCREATLTRHDLYTADECFLTGTAAEVIPVVDIDGRTIGNGVPGPVTSRLKDDFHVLVRQ